MPKNNALTLKRFMQLGFSLIITGIFVFVLWRWIDWPRFRVMVATVQLSYVGLGALCYIGVYLARAVRMRAIIPKTTIPDLFWINSVQYFFNKILPARTGELTLPVLIQRYTGASFGRGVAVLLLLRFFDILVIVALLTISLYVISVPPLMTRALPWLMAAETGGLLVIFALPVLLKKIELQAIAKLTTFVQQPGYVRFILGGLRDTIIAWVFLYGYLYCMVLATHGAFSFWAVVFAATFSILTIVLPISAIGNFGTFEAGWVLGFVMLGMAKTDALAVGFFTNIVLTILNGLLAGIGFMILEYHRKQV